MNLNQITSPTLLLDKTKCQNNIRLMANKAKKHGLVFRPHFKTHQSRIIGSWFKQAGINKITVSSLKMAEYFANDDWKDITVAFPANIREIELLNSLAEEIQLNLTIENVESVIFLNNELKFQVGFYIKIDTGYRRTGVSFDIFLTIDKILKAAESSDKLLFKGFLSHEGNKYHEKGPQEVLEIHKDAMHKLSLLKKHYFNKYPDLLMSIGDTPSNSIAEDFLDINEIRPGNFVFYDLMQLGIGSCNPEEIAVIMVCPVVAKHPDRKEIIIHGGAIHFSKESFCIDDKILYGKLVQLNENGWNTNINNSFLTKLSQEHGTLQVTDEVMKNIYIGDLVGIIPVHSCLTANLMKEYLTTDDELIDHL